MPVRKTLTPRQKMFKAVIRQAQMKAYEQGYMKAKEEETPWFFNFFLGFLFGLTVSVGFFK